MSAAAVVIALFIDGVQVLLPAPAFIEDGTSWVPARVVLERMGCQASFDEKTARLTVTNSAQEGYQLTPDGTPAAPGAPELRTYVYRNIDEYLYITTKAMSDMTGSWAGWDRARLRLDLGTAPASARAADVTTIGELLSTGPEAVGQTVAVEGEYLGRSGGDGKAWLLRGDGGTLLCANAPRMVPPFPMTAYGSRGRRLRVRGTVVSEGERGIRVLVSEAMLLSGPLGLVCLMEFARPGRDGSLRLHLVTRNPGQVIAPLNGTGMAIRAKSQFGNDLHFLEVKSVSITRPEPPEGRVHSVIECDTAGLTPGTYSISAEPLSGIRTYEVMVRLGE